MPNPYVSLTDLDPDVAKIQRQRQLADMLQQQSSDSIPIQSYNGVQAPISPFSVLAKALKGYAAKKYQDKADEEMSAYRDRDMAAAQALARQLTQGSPQVGTPNINPGSAQINAAPPQLPGGPAPAPAMAPVGIPGQQGTGMTQAPPDINSQLAAIMAARGGPQTQMIQQAMLPQIMNRQNFDYQHQLGRKDLAEDRTYAESRAIKRPATAEEKARYGIDPKTPAEIDVNGNITPITDPNQMTAAQQDASKRGWAEINKPVALSYGATLVDPRTHQVVFDGGAAGAASAPKPDPTAPNLTGQTGLSLGGFNYLIGNTAALPRDARSRSIAQKEANDFAARSGTDISSLQSQYKAYNNVLQTNLQKSNTMEILNKEVQGTVQNLAPVADKLGGGNLRWTKEGAQFVGGLGNDPNAQQYAFYLTQLRADLAGFNAVSGGKMDQHGNAHADDSDFRAAERVIQNGLDSGGARGLAQAVAQTGIKNRAIVDSQIDDANRGIWTLFGVGKNYRPKHNSGASNPSSGKVPPPPPGFVVHP